ncbi:hypothetical protein DKK70_05845 [Gilliamella apicola]|uniref:Uncharacterized protein n=1 Tax=Gilliamella apicola TaxID=1196095 RepID=A0A2V4E498_9GAMM|nr:hypothetical protein [Gilliamella apicola]PXZ07373.1 hypothetical protein DKK70_05845 [Gilliamella apicola]
MNYNFKSTIWITYNSTSLKLSSQTLYFAKIYCLSKLHEIARVLSQSLQCSFLSGQLLLGLMFVLPLITSYSSLALTSKTSNIINGRAPYLTFDGGRSQATNIDELLGISLSDGSIFTPATPNSRDDPIVLPVAGQSFADIGMLVPTNTDSITLGSLIGSPYNYWGDDDGDGQGGNGITVTGSLSLSIVDKNNQPVGRNEVLTVCNAPYKLTLSSTEGTLTTRYGVPNESHFSASNVSYYINPKAAPVICFAKPNMRYGGTNYYPHQHSGPATIWNPDKGFLVQSVTPSSYGSNFPTTGANGLYFDLEIAGVAQPLTWKEVSPNGDIKATMTNSTNTSVRVTLKGPAVTDSAQWGSSNPDSIGKPSFPQVFELVGLDNNNNEVVKYGFVLKQWFATRGDRINTDKFSYTNTSSWCTKIGYRFPMVKDLTNAVKGNISGATPASTNDNYQRHIGAGFFTEWGSLVDYLNFNGHDFYYWVDNGTNQNDQYVVSFRGSIVLINAIWQKWHGICVYP